MSHSASLLDVIDPRPMVRASRFRFFALRARGVPAILCGAAAIVVAAGVAGAMRRAVLMVPETLREARMLLTVLRAGRHEYLG